MDCTSFIERMDALADDDLSTDERGALERHLESCAACRELSRALGGESQATAVAPPAGMAASRPPRQSSSSRPAPTPAHRSPVARAVRSDPTSCRISA